MQQRSVDEEQVEDLHEAAKPTPAPCLVAAGLCTTSNSRTKINSGTSMIAKTSNEHKSSTTHSKPATKTNSS